MNTQELLSPATQRPHTIIPFPASQSLQASAVRKNDVIPTGLSGLDAAICPPSAEESDIDFDSRGIPQGHVTEVFGPPGVGKTALALNIASIALCRGRKIVWIDTGSPLPRIRLRDVLQGAIQRSSSSQRVEDLMQNMIHLRAQSLPHLLALLLHSPPGFPPPECDLVVIDSASGPFPSYFPNPTELKTRLAQSKITDKAQVQWLMNRSSNVTSDLANQLMKLATTLNMAVLAINQTRTRIKGQPRATLSPILAGGAWESSINTRIVLYRDFATTEEGNLSGNIRFAEVMKRAGKILVQRLGENIVPFVIESGSLRAFDDNPCPRTAAASPSEPPEQPAQRKRKVDEIADSQDEDSDAEYGWVDGDDAGVLEK